ncbi:galactose-specific lectin nattectin-like [Synchiropus picturatus]
MESWAVFALLCTTVGLSAASGSSQRVNSCPQSWSFYNGRCFYVERRRMNWTQAQDNCQSMGGSLASIENMVEQQLIQELIRNGANTLPVSWVGGTSGEESVNQGFGLFRDAGRAGSQQSVGERQDYTLVRTILPTEYAFALDSGWRGGFTAASQDL